MAPKTVAKAAPAKKSASAKELSDTARKRWRGSASVPPRLLTLHPLVELFPEMAADDYAAFVECVRTHGISDPVWIDDQNRIVDGRHRWRAANDLNLNALPTRPISDRFLTKESEIREFVIAQNLNRRHLNESQRALIAASLATASPGRPKKGKNSTGSGKTVASASADLNVSAFSTKAGKKVLNSKLKSLIDAVKAGSISVSLAAEAVDTLDGRSIRDILNNGYFTDKAKGLRDAVKAALAVDSGQLIVDSAKAVDSGQLIVDSEENTAGTAVLHSLPSDITDWEPLLDLTAGERAWLSEHGYTEEPFNPYNTDRCLTFRRKVGKKLLVELNFSFVLGLGPSWIASYKIPGTGVGCGGGTIGFYETLESAGAGIEEWITKVQEENTAGTEEAVDSGQLTVDSGKQAHAEPYAALCAVVEAIAALPAPAEYHTAEGAAPDVPHFGQALIDATWKLNDIEDVLHARFWGPGIKTDPAPETSSNAGALVAHAEKQAAKKAGRGLKP